MNKIKEIDEKIEELQELRSRLANKTELVLGGIEFEFDTELLRVENFQTITYLDKNEIKELREFIDKITIFKCHNCDYVGSRDTYEENDKCIQCGEKEKW